MTDEPRPDSVPADVRAAVPGNESAAASSHSAVASSSSTVQSLARGLAVIRAFDADHPQLTLSDVARRA